MTTPDRGHPDRARGASGKFVISVESAENAAEAARLRSRGMTYRDIAKTVGYCDASAARRAVQRALVAIVAEPAAEVRQMQLAQLDELTAAALAVLEREHVTVSHGRVIYDEETGKPLLDHSPVLAAVDRLLRIQERRAKLLGLDAPARVEVMTIDAIDAEIARLTRELSGAPEPAGAEAAEAAPAEASAPTQS